MTQEQIQGLARGGSDIASENPEVSKKLIIHGHCVSVIASMSTENP